MFLCVKGQLVPLDFNEIDGRPYAVKTCCVLDGGGFEEDWPIVME